MTVDLANIDPYEFEELVAFLWEQQGWETEVTSSSKDRGIDVIAKKNVPYPEKALIQVKKYSPGNKVGSGEVRKYATLYQQEDVDTVIIVTSSEFTRQAETLADDLSVKTVNGKALEEIISTADVASSIKQFGSKEVEDDYKREPDKQHRELSDSFTISDQCNKCGFVLIWNPNSRLARCSGCGNVFKYRNHRWVPKGSKPETSSQENRTKSKGHNDNSDSQSTGKGVEQRRQEKRPRRKKSLLQKISDFLYRL